MRLWWLPVIQILWVNSHGMSILGIILLGFVFLRYPLVLLGPFLLTALATLVNPYGWRGALYPFYLRQVSADPVYRLIREGLSFGDPGVPSEWYIVWGFWCGLLLFSISVGRRTLGWVYFLWLGFSVYFSTTMVRNLSPAVLMTLPFILAGAAETLTRFSLIPKKRSLRKQQFAVVSMTGLFCGGLILGSLDGLRDHFHFDWKITASDDLKAAATFIKDHQLQGRMFATPEFSNFMLWQDRDFKTYIDTRYAEVVPKEHFQKMFRLFLNPIEIESETERYQISTLAINHTVTSYHGAIRFFLQNPKWRPVYLDHFMIFFIKQKDRQDISSLTGERVELFLKTEMKNWQQTQWMQAASKKRAYQALVATTLLGGEKIALQEMAPMEERMDLKMKNLYCSLLTYHAKGLPLDTQEQNKILTKAQNICEYVFEASKDVSAAYNLSAVLSLLQQYESALSWIDQTIQLNPQAFTHYLLKAAILKQLDARKYEQAIHECYQTSLRLNPFQLTLWKEFIPTLKDPLEKTKSIRLARSFYPQDVELQNLEKANK